AKFLEEGFIEKHIRRIKRNYKRKNYLMQRYIRNNFAGRVEILSSDSGLNMVLGFRTKGSAEEVSDSFEKKGILAKVIGRSRGQVVVSLAYSGFPIEFLEGLSERETVRGENWMDSFLV
ncbi:MAG: hypothetical protein C0604_03890, partial [Clostridiales bacterium]